MLEHTQEEDHTNALFVEKSFSCKSHLIRHINTHREKPFQCVDCEITFLEKNMLMEHLRTHTGEKQHNALFALRYFHIKVIY